MPPVLFFEVSYRICTLLMDLTLYTAIVGVAGLVAVAVEKRRRPLARAFLARAGAAALFLAVVAGLAPRPVFYGVNLPSALPDQAGPIAAPAPNAPQRPALAAAVRPPSEPVAPPVRAADRGAGADAAGRAGSIYDVVAALWLTGCCIFLLRLARDAAAVGGMRRRSAALSRGPVFGALAELVSAGARPVELRETALVAAPVLAGLARPALFVPPGFGDRCDFLSVKAIIAHELAHRDRNDNSWLLAGRILCAIVWFQPIAWLVHFQMAHCAEGACDVAAIASGCSPKMYANCLLSLATASRNRLASGAGIAGFGSNLGSRIRAIVGGVDMRPPSRRLRWRAGASFALLTGAIVSAIGQAPAGPGPVSSAPALTPFSPDGHSAGRRDEQGHPFVVIHGTRAAFAWKPDPRAFRYDVRFEESVHSPRGSYDTRLGPLEFPWTLSTQRPSIQIDFSKPGRAPVFNRNRTFALIVSAIDRDGAPLWRRQASVYFKPVDSPAPEPFSTAALRARFPGVTIASIDRSGSTRVTIRGRTAPPAMPYAWTQVGAWFGLDEDPAETSFDDETGEGQGRYSASYGQ